MMKRKRVGGGAFRSICLDVALWLASFSRGGRAAQAIGQAETLGQNRGTIMHEKPFARNRKGDGMPSFFHGAWQHGSMAARAKAALTDISTHGAAPSQLKAAKTQAARSLWMLRLESTDHQIKKLLPNGSFADGGPLLISRDFSVGTRSDRLSTNSATTHTDRQTDRGTPRQRQWQAARRPAAATASARAAASPAPRSAGAWEAWAARPAARAGGCVCAGCVNW